MNYGPISIPDPADYDMRDPAQCQDFYSDLREEYGELTNIAGGFLPYAGPILEEYLNDLGDPVMERLQNQDCKDANQNDISDGWELPEAAPEPPADASEAGLPPPPVDGPAAPEDAGPPQDDVIWLPPHLVEGTPPQEPIPPQDQVVDLPPFLIEGPPGETDPAPPQGEVVDLPPFLIEGSPGETGAPEPEPGESVEGG